MLIFGPFSGMIGMLVADGGGAVIVGKLDPTPPPEDTPVSKVSPESVVANPTGIYGANGTTEPAPVVTPTVGLLSFATAAAASAAADELGLAGLEAVPS